MMPETLYGKEVFMGRESGSNRLLVYFSINGRIKAFEIGNPDSVPTSVSRAVPTQNKAHASISIENSGNMTLTNLKEENVTFVNGTKIVAKRISEDDQIELGSGHYLLPLKDILKSLSKLQNSQIQNPVAETSHRKADTCNISHLQKVWNTYHEGDLAIKDRQHKLGLMQRVPMFFTFGAGALTSVSLALNWPEWIKIVSICLTGIVLIYLFIQSSKFNPVREADQLREDFQRKYICPNPECGRFLGYYSYSMMKNQYKMECPYCKSKFVER